MNTNFDVIIIGAGASGYLCAITAIENGKTVAIIDHQNFGLRKVKVSGGGKCNFTNLDTDYSKYLSSNPKFCISALKQYTPNDFVSLVEKHNISFYHKTPNQLFCRIAAEEIVNMLKAEAKDATMFYNQKISKVAKKYKDYQITTQHHVLTAKSLVIATGGLSYSELGASDFGYKIAKDFGHKIIPAAPALVPINLDNDIMKESIKLKGSSLMATVKTKNFSIKDYILFTHFGLSGPAILQASLYWQRNETMEINLLPDVDIKACLLQLRETSKGKKLSSFLKQHFSDKIVTFLMKEEDKFISELSNKSINAIADSINNWKIIPNGTQSYKLAEATKGGICVDDICSNSMESKLSKNLFFIGEVLDVTGLVGGYNLQWAWSSGYCAGKNV